MRYWSDGVQNTGNSRYFGSNLAAFFSDCSMGISINVAGIPPVSLLLDISRKKRSCSLLIQDGIGPVS
uniref:Uncharacterized protein n=1 Tax=Arundo donax TaxID=35708 RepID=A0A0A9G2S5_ARUDO